MNQNIVAASDRNFTQKQTAELQTPQKLAAQYRYIELLGEGANGKTYLAEVLGTGARVAIKALKLNQSASFKSFELFKREAETLSSIHVHGVPKFYESILSDDIGGECYIIQEYVDAPSIQSYLDDGRVFSERETLWVMLHVADILYSLHTQYSPPIIHRDIKPSNILCRLPDNKDGWAHIEPYLIDFGAVANAQSNSDKSTVAGTVGYMAPEQNFNECLPQTDFYALGATALHMLTGVAPYEMDFNTYALDYRKVLKAHAPKTSRNMCALLGCLLDYSYDKRPANATILVSMIDRVLAGRKPVPRRMAVSGTGRFWAWIKWTFFRLHIFWTDLSTEIDFVCLKKRSDDPSRPECDIKFDFKNYGIVSGTIHCQISVSLPNKRSYQKDKNYLEYTFTVEGETWCGSDCNQPWWLDETMDDFEKGDYLSQKILNKLRNHLNGGAAPLPSIRPCAIPRSYYGERDRKQGEPLNFPLKCVVIYMRKDPSINRIYYILQNNKSSE